MTLHSTTHDLTDRLFWHTIRLDRKSDLYHRFLTHETQYPYRESNSRIFRLPFSTFGLVFGKWEETGRTEEESLLAALGGREVPADSIEGMTRPVQAVSMDDQIQALSDQCGLLKYFPPGSSNA